MERKNGGKTTFALHSEIQDHLHWLWVSRLSPQLTWSLSQNWQVTWAYMVWNTLWNNLFCVRAWLVAPH